MLIGLFRLKETRQNGWHWRLQVDIAMNSSETGNIFRDLFSHGSSFRSHLLSSVGTVPVEARSSTCAQGTGWQVPRSRIPDWRSSQDRGSAPLTSIGRIPIDAPPLAVQKVGQLLAIVRACTGDRYRMDKLSLAVGADVHLHGEMPLIMLLGPFHFRITRPGLFLGRSRSTDNRGIDNGSNRELQALVLQMPANFLKQALAGAALLQQMSKAQNHRLIWRRFDVIPNSATV